MGTRGILMPHHAWQDYSGLLFASLEETYTAVQHAAFAQGYAVKRARTSREKRVGEVDPSGPLVRLDMRCVCSGPVGARIYRTRSQKTGCPFKAIASVRKSQGSRWVLRVVDGRHNHPPEEWLLDNKEYREWFARRVGGANEIERLLATARMTAATYQAPVPQAQKGVSANDNRQRAGDGTTEGGVKDSSDLQSKDGSNRQDSPSRQLDTEMRENGRETDGGEEGEGRGDEFDEGDEDENEDDDT
jgi:hypothetical protein